MQYIECKTYVVIHEFHAKMSWQGICKELLKLCKGCIAILLQLMQMPRTMNLSSMPYLPKDWILWDMHSYSDEIGNV